MPFQERLKVPSSNGSNGIQSNEHLHLNIGNVDTRCQRTRQSCVTVPMGAPTNSDQGVVQVVRVKGERQAAQQSVREVTGREELYLE